MYTLTLFTFLLEIFGMFSESNGYDHFDLLTSLFPLFLFLFFF